MPPPPRPQRRPRAAPRAAAAALAAPALAAVALAGCGSKAVARAGVIARGNAICATAARETANLPASAGRPGGSTFAFEADAPIFTREAKAMDALPVPKARRALFERFIAAEDALAAGYRRLAAAQRAGNDAAIRRTTPTLEGNDALRLAGEYGMSQCSGPVATVR